MYYPANIFLHLSFPGDFQEMAAVVTVATNTLENIQDLDMYKLKVVIAQLKYQIGDTKMVG